MITFKIKHVLLFVLCLCISQIIIAQETFVNPELQPLPNNYKQMAWIDNDNKIYNKAPAQKETDEGAISQINSEEQPEEMPFKSFEYPFNSGKTSFEDEATTKSGTVQSQEEELPMLREGKNVVTQNPPPER